MALILKDRVQETSTTTGTGTLTLAGAVTQFQTFSSAIGNGNTTYYTIYNAGGTEWEVGLGTVGAGTLARTTVYASSNAGSLVNFTGTLYVFCDYPATKAVYADASNKLRVDGNPYVDFEDANGTTVAAGRMWYSNTTGSWNLGMGGGNITQQVGEELFVYGKASSAITEGQLIQKTGVVGASGVITFAPTSANLTDDQVIIGIATENIPLNGFGRITAFGVVHGINTSAFTDNATLWYDPAGGGAMTATKPSAPNVKCEVGIVINAGSGSSGSIQVEILHGTQLGGTDSNVTITTPTGGQILTYNETGGYWKNTSLSAGTAISVTPTIGGSLTVTNTAPDQTVSLTAGTGISTSGTYPSFTITNTAPDQTVVLTAGTGISTSGTYPSFTIANTGVTAYPGAGIPNSTGSAWGTSYTTTGSGTVVALATTPSITNPTVTNYVETLYAPSAGTSFTIDLANGTVQEISLNGNGTITLPSSVAGKSYVIIVTYSGAYTLTWAGGSTIKWPGGTAPTASSASGKFDIFTFFCDGTNTYGQSFGLNY